jgi:hypothetical protein
MLAASEQPEQLHQEEEYCPIIPKKRKRVVDSDDEGDDCEDCESEDIDDEETEEDRAFINDGRVEKAEQDAAAVDPKNIIADESGGRPKRQRKAPTRWEHPDAATVMRKFCDKWQVTEDDIKEIFEDDEPEDEEVKEDDSSFHSDDDDDDDEVPTDEDDAANDEDEEEEEEDYDSEAIDEDD